MNNKCLIGAKNIHLITFFLSGRFNIFLKNSKFFKLQLTTTSCQF